MHVNDFDESLLRQLAAGEPVATDTDRVRRSLQRLRAGGGVDLDAATPSGWAVTEAGAEFLARMDGAAAAAEPSVPGSV